MLTMNQKYHIKHLSFHKGQSLRSIAEETGHDFRTVKKYIMLITAICESPYYFLYLGISLPFSFLV